MHCSFRIYGLRYYGIMKIGVGVTENKLKHGPETGK
jgi:hypothetical protein